MPRRKRECPAGLPVHVVQRGNNRQICFASNSDFRAYANWLKEAAIEYGVEIHAWVFMTNHVHLLVTPQTSDSVSKCMQLLGRHYVRYFNYRYQRTGTLFEGRFRSSLIQNQKYFLACQRYIELNPVRAGLVKDPSEYAWSSYECHASGRVAGMWHPHSEYLALGQTVASRLLAYRNLFADVIDNALVSDIRRALNAGLALGNNRFLQEIETLTGQRQSHLKPGPKKSKSGELEKFLH